MRAFPVNYYWGAGLNLLLLLLLPLRCWQGNKWPAGHLGTLALEQCMSAYQQVWTGLSVTCCYMGWQLRGCK